MTCLLSSTSRTKIAVLFLVGCGSTANDVPEGQAIAGTEIVSCGDELAGAAPAGGIDGSIVVASTGSTFEATASWQATCPKGESDAQTQFDLAHLTVYRSEGGYPGEKLGERDVAMRGVVSCAQRTNLAIAGATVKSPMSTLEVPDLTAMCTAFEAAPTGAPLWAIVELTGRATTCSNTQSNLLFRSKVAVKCPR